MSGRRNGRAAAPRRYRLRGAVAFGRILRSGRRLETSRVQLIVAPAAEAPGRIGYVIGARQLPRAVDRNRLKRILREALRARLEAVSGFDIVLRLRRACVRSELPVIASEAVALIKTLEGMAAG